MLFVNGRLTIHICLVAMLHIYVHLRNNFLLMLIQWKFAFKM